MSWETWRASCLCCLMTMTEHKYVDHAKDICKARINESPVVVFFISPEELTTNFLPNHCAFPRPVMIAPFNDLVRGGMQTRQL